MYSCSAQVHVATSVPPFGLVLSTHPLDLECSTVRPHFVLTPQRLQLPTNYKQGCYIATAQCINALISKLRFHNDATKSITTKRFARRPRRSALDSTSTSADDQWQPLSLSVWLLSCTASWCPRDRMFKNNLNIADDNQNRWARNSEFHLNRPIFTGATGKMHRVTTHVHVRRGSEQVRQQSRQKWRKDYHTKTHWFAAQTRSRSHCASFGRSQ